MVMAIMEVGECSTTMELSACPTVDAIKALIENLVDPLLPLKTSDVPSKALRESVAKQIHAVVLVYNYYHRRNHPHLECLSFEWFRSFITEMRPALEQHFKESSDAGGDGDSEQIKSLEKVILDARNLSMSLDASSDISSLKKLPIRKVAVLLVDFDKTICFLRHSSITQGVWSLLETTVKEEKTACGNQKEEAVFQKAAFAAIKEVTGVDHNDIVILEKHLVYSLSEEKTSVQFYIMKRISQEKFQNGISIDVMLSCIQGPLFEKGFSEWATNPIVEYFLILPYASLIEDWFSRRRDTELVLEKESEAVCCDIVSTGNADATKESEVSNTRIGETAASSKANIVTASVRTPRPRRIPTPREHNQYLKRNTIVVKEPTVPLLTVCGLKANYTEYEMNYWKESHLHGKQGGLEVNSDSQVHRAKGNQRKKAIAGKIKSTKKRNAAPVSAPDSNVNLEELQTSPIPRATSPSDTEDHIERDIQRKKAFAGKTKSTKKRIAAPVSAPDSNVNLEELQTSRIPRRTSPSDTEDHIEIGIQRKKAFAGKTKSTKKRIAAPVSAPDSNVNHEEPQTSRIPRTTSLSDSEDHIERDIQRTKTFAGRPKSTKKRNAAPVSAPDSNVNHEEPQTSLIPRTTSLSDSEDHIERDIQRTKAFAGRPKSTKKRNAAPVSAPDSNVNHEELQTSLLSRATSLSETALKVLLCKRDKLTAQQRQLEDEIAECDKSIQNIKGNVALQLETILEGCNETYLRRNPQESLEESACQSNKRQKLCELLPAPKSQCQTLDDICLANNWVLPTYHVSPSHGGYRAAIRIKETHFPYALRGDEMPDVEKARESAAVCLMATLPHNSTAKISHD